MSEYEKASKGAYYLFLSQIVALAGGIAMIIVSSVYILSTIVPLYTISSVSVSTSVGSGVVPTNSTASLLSQVPPGLISRIMEGVLLMLAFGLIVGIVQLVLMVFGWRNLSEFNSSEYHTSFIGSIMNLIGLLLVVPPGTYLVSLLRGALISYRTTQTFPAQTLAGAVSLMIPIFIGLLILVVGYILVLIGFWRLGSQFNSTLIKAAVILVIVSIVVSLFLSSILPVIPELLGIISAILLTVGLYSVSKNAKVQGSTQTSPQ